jgi:hypothetical protein
MEQQTREKRSANPVQRVEVLSRLQDAAEKSRKAFDGAMDDFRNRFTIGSTIYDQDENRD